MPEPAFVSMDGETLLKSLQQWCTQKGASDIHLSPQKEGVRLEVRLHGILDSIAVISHPRYADFLRRVKFESKLKLNITNIPQDGQYVFQAQTISTDGKPQNRTVNVRVATLPSRF